MGCLCVASKGDPTGYLVINGQTLSTTDIARLTGGSEAEVDELLIELERNGVFSRDSKDRIYCRRMVRDVKKASVARKNGKRGGNPSLSKQKEISASDNQPDNPTLKLRSQKPETRIEKEEPKGSPKKGTRITDDWDPGPDGVAYAEQKGLSSKQICIEVEKFRNYFLAAPGQKAIKVDWLATWKNWVINSQSRYGADRSGSIPAQSTMGLDDLRRRASVDRLPPTPRKASA